MAKLSALICLFLLTGATFVASQEETPEPEPTVGPTGDTPPPTRTTTTRTTTSTTQAPTTTRNVTSTTPRTTPIDDCEYDFIPDVDCPPFEPDLPTYFPYPYDCTKFIECTNGEPEVHCCAEGTIWDQEIETCNHPSQTECIILTTVRTTPTTTTPTTTTPTTTTPTTTTPTTTTPTTTTPTTTTPTTTEAPTTTDDPATWICPEGYEGPIMHPWTCTQFYICDPGQRPCLYDCPPPLFYNPDTQDCDWQYNVPICVGGTPPPPTTTRRPILSGEPLKENYRNVKRFIRSNIKEIVERRRSNRGLYQQPGPCDEPTFEFY